MNANVPVCRELVFATDTSRLTLLEVNEFSPTDMNLEGEVSKNDLNVVLFKLTEPSWFVETPISDKLTSVSENPESDERNIEFTVALTDRIAESVANAPTPEFVSLLVISERYEFSSLKSLTNFSNFSSATLLEY